MSEFRSPRRVKPNKRVEKREYRKDLVDISRVQGHVANLGGEAAFERRMEALGTSHGSSYGLPRVHSQKKLHNGRYFEEEVPLRGVAPLSKGMKTKEGLLLMPGGFAHATVPIPKGFRSAFSLSAHSTSTFARCGVNISHYQTVLDRHLTRRTLPPTMEVQLHNWSTTSVLIREGDPCRLVNLAEVMASIVDPRILKTSPRTTFVNRLVKLHAGDQVVRVNEAALQKVIVGASEVRYVDPHAPNFSEQFRTESFRKLHLRRGDFIVISTREQKIVPPGHVALVHDAADHLHHTSARLVHSGSRGILALEFQALHDGTIKPGDHVAFLTAHAVNDSRAAYTGRYIEQGSVAPKAREPKEIS